MKTPLIVLLALVLLASGVAQAQMAKSLKDKFHDEKALGIVVVGDKDINKLDVAMADPAIHLIAAQITPKAMTNQRAQALLKWVRAGHTLWIYDARVGPWFGFKPYLMSKEQFTNKPGEDGELGGEKYDGVATTGLVIKEIDVTTGVGYVSLFLQKIEGDKYGGMLVEGDTIPLLQFKLDSPAVAAMRWEGRGLIVFKSLLWPDVQSGDRFQSNLIEFSAGFPVPGPGGEDKVGDPPGPKHAYIQGNPAMPLLTTSLPEQPALPSPPPQVSGPAPTPTPETARPLNDQLEGPEGVVKGAVMNEIFHFETGNKSLTLKRQEVKSLVMGGSIDLDQLITWDGVTQHGVLLDQKLQFDVGKEVKTYKKQEVHRVDLAPPPGPGPAPKP